MAFFFSELDRLTALKEKRKERWAKMFESKDLCALCAEPSAETLDDPDLPDDDRQAIQALGRRVWPCPREQGGCGAWWHISCLERWLRFEDWCTNCESQLDESVAYAQENDAE